MEEKVDWTDCPLVVSVPDRMNGLPVVDGTRLPADDVVDLYEQGRKAYEIAEDFGVKPKTIRSILSYARSHSHKPALMR